jgi:nicotinamide riboside kinase
MNPKQAKIIVCTGPESSGKTTISRWMGEELGMVYVPEMAREYFKNRTNQYTLDDVMQIADLQLNAIAEAADKNQTIIADTDLLTILIWLEDKFKLLNIDLYFRWKQSLSSAVYLLCKPDIPWEADSLREDSNRRMVLFNMHLHWLKTHHANYYIIDGELNQRKLLIANWFNK